MSDPNTSSTEKAESGPGRPMCANGQHEWQFDGYFWHHCMICGAVS
mgnify:FL=1